jgi:amidase
MDSSRRGFLKQLVALSAMAPTGLLSQGCRRERDAVVHGGASLLHEHDGIGLAELIRAGEITSVELVEEVLRQVERLHPSLNAVVQGLFDPDLARARARQALGQGRLAGVPVMLKNLTGYRAAKIDYGSRLYARAFARGVGPASGTSAVPEGIEAAGMIVAGITNSAEFGLIDTTEPILHGATRNPWNADYTAGGSSGGAAAVVAARIVPVAHGNDGAGSIRIPAAHCAVFGLKPSRGRETGSGSPSGILNISSELCLSRSVRDTAAFLSEIEKRADPGLPPVGFVQGPSLRRLRIAFAINSLLGVPPDPAVERAVRHAADLCEQLGHEVDEISLSIDGAELMDAFVGLWATTILHLDGLVVELLGEGAKATDVLEPWTLGLMTLAKARGRELSILRAMDAFGKASARMESLFTQYDVMLSPVLRRPPFPLGYYHPTRDFGTLMEHFRNDIAYTPLQNATGMPAMSVPLHWTADGLPVGIHFSAWRGRERTLLELAYELEEARPWAGRAPRITVH